MVTTAAHRHPAAASPPGRHRRAEGRRDFFSTGIHLNVIGASPDPAEDSWRDLNATKDVVRDIVTTDSHFIIAALPADAAAGGYLSRPPPTTWVARIVRTRRHNLYPFCAGCGRRHE